MRGAEGVFGLQDGDCQRPLLPVAKIKQEISIDWSPPCTNWEAMHKRKLQYMHPAHSARQLWTCFTDYVQTENLQGP